MFYFDKDINKFVLKGSEKWPLEWTIVPHVVSILIISVIIITLSLIINRKIKRANPLEKPTGLLLLVELLVTTIDNFTVEMLGEKIKSLSPYFGFLAIYLFMANTIGLFGFTPPTANLSVTFTFGLTTFILVRYYGVKFNKWDHLKGLFKPVLLTPINIIGELAVPFSLSIRLFGNILSGAVIMTLIYGGFAMLGNVALPFIGKMGPFASFLVVPPASFLHIYFDLFSGLIQTFVFILLSSVFISNASE